MCGIAGVYEYGRAEGGVTMETVVDMRDALIHRGPDGEGAWLSPDKRVGLGHRRLAIVGLSDGAQPMFGDNGEVLVYNGEIYNYPRLRRELQGDGVRFKTSCDTEVILHLYARYAERCVDHLNGMFAFALWDPRRERLVFARDRIGEKPLYWTATGGRMLFGSEIKAILRHPAAPLGVNTSQLVPYLAHLVVPSPATLYEGINKLAPGEMAICDRDGVRTERYWDIRQPREWRTDSLGAASRQVREMLERSVTDRLMSDVPVGVLLSGGLDSTTLVALLREKAKGLATFSVGSTDDASIDERGEARWVADHFGTDHHEVAMSEQDAIGFLPELIHHQDEPLADPVCIPLHFVCRLAKENNIKVVLAGEGADELFWGYPRYSQVMAKWRYVQTLLALPRMVRKSVPRMIPRGRKAHLRDLLEGIATGRPSPLHMPLGLAREHRQKVLGRYGAGVGWSPSQLNGNRADPLSVLGFDTQEYEFGLRLPELLLMRIDRFSMANSVEARVPFLDPDLVEYVYRLPLDLKLHNGMTKVVLREAIADIVPDQVLKRAKQGFGAPVSSWFNTGVGELFERMLGEDGLRQYFDVDGLRGLLAQHHKSGGLGFVLWPVLNFALWHKHWIEGESIEPFLDALGQRR